MKNEKLFNHFAKNKIEIKEIEPKIIVAQTKKKLIAKNDWSKDIMELETYFKNTMLPTIPIKLNECAVITNLNNFIDTHLKAIKTNKGKPSFEPYLIRLYQLKQIISLNAKSNN